MLLKQSACRTWCPAGRTCMIDHSRKRWAGQAQTLHAAIHAIQYLCLDLITQHRASGLYDCRYSEWQLWDWLALREIKFHSSHSCLMSLYLSVLISVLGVTLFGGYDSCGGRDYGRSFPEQVLSQRVWPRYIAFHNLELCPLRSGQVCL